MRDRAREILAFRCMRDDLNRPDLFGCDCLTLTAGCAENALLSGLGLRHHMELDIGRTERTAVCTSG